MLREAGTHRSHLEQSGCVHEVLRHTSRSWDKGGVGLPGGVERRFDSLAAPRLKRAS